jgi:hypothetical protein
MLRRSTAAHFDVRTLVQARLRRRPRSSDVSKHAVERPRHLGEIERFDE